MDVTIRDSESVINSYIYKSYKQLFPISCSRRLKISSKAAGMFDILTSPFIFYSKEKSG